MMVKTLVVAGVVCAALLSFATGQIVLDDDFESYALDAWPAVNWTPVWNAVSDPSNNKITVDPAAPGNKVLKMYGRDGWSADARRWCSSFPIDVIVEIRMWNGSEARPAGWGRGSIALMNTRTLLNYYSDGRIVTGVGDINESYDTERWYHIKIRYRREGTLLHMTVWIDNVEKISNTVEMSAAEAEATSHTIVLNAGCTVYFDDLKIYTNPNSTTGSAIWVKRFPDVHPSARYYHRMVFDSQRNRTVLYGGSHDFGELTDTWEHDGQIWEKIQTNDNPSVGAGCNMVFDANRNRTVLFGGIKTNAGLPMSDTWEYDGLNWTKVNPATSPSARYDHAMAFDATRKRVVLFGGGVNPNRQNDTWEFDGTTWIEMHPTTTPPPAFGNAMIYDSVHKRVVLFDGQHGGTWEWDGLNWIAREPVTTPPSRVNFAMAYDSRRNRVVVFGGKVAPAYPQNRKDTWEWDGNDWVQVFPILCPSERYGIAMVFDSFRNRAILFGGDDDDGLPPFSDTWEYFLPNEPPVADAGPDQTVYELTRVVLDGSGSLDPEAEELTFSWAQIGGATVSMDLTDPVHPTFVAPLVPVGGATLSFELTVSDGESTDTDVVDICVKNVNHPPVADAGEDQVVSEGSGVVLDGSGSYDPDGEEFKFCWEQIGGPTVALNGCTSMTASFVAPLITSSAETLVFRLTVNDGTDVGVDTVSVVVENVNHPPVADAGVDQTRDEGGQVTLNGTASSDPDQDSLAYYWTQIGGVTVMLSDRSSATPFFEAPEVSAGGADLVFQLVVYDGAVWSKPDEVVVHVLNVNDPPSTENAFASPGLLWPPDHKLVEVKILGVTDPQSDRITITVTSVMQDEPVNGLGDGDTGPDAVIRDGTLYLRAERAGMGNGRMYRVSFKADDGKGGVRSGSVTVSVPPKRKAKAVDDGPCYDSLLP